LRLFFAFKSPYSRSFHPLFYYENCFSADVAGRFSFAVFLPRAEASIAYRSINNFDTVNDTGTECHGFEIEDCSSVDISYTYDYNHYGVCKITQDSNIQAHPKMFIRWESKKMPMALGRLTRRSPGGRLRRPMGIVLPIRR
jgi:hypothetical protein